MSGAGRDIYAMQWDGTPDDALRIVRWVQSDARSRSTAHYETQNMRGGRIVVTTRGIEMSAYSGDLVTRDAVEFWVVQQ